MPHGRTGRRTDYQWSNFGDVEAGLDLSTATGRFGTTGLVSLVPHTCMRIRGRVAARLSAGTVDEDAFILVGLVKVATDSFVGGAAPEIFTNSDDEASWIWQGVLYVSSGTEAAVANDGLEDVIDVDSKAMRKFKVNDTLAFVSHTPAELVTDQAGTYDLKYYFHVLRGE